jgi:DNA-binding HxlR family transcriptional regulator
VPVKIDKKARPAWGMDASCPVTVRVAFLEKKWMLPLLFELFSSSGAKRFSELQRALTPITPKVLALRLTELERAGYLYKRVISKHETEYSVTKESSALRRLVAFFKAECTEHSPASASKCASCPEKGRCLLAYGV